MGTLLNKLTCLLVLGLALFSNCLVADENRFSYSSYGDEFSSKPDKFFYYNELEGILFLDGEIEKGMYTNFRQAIIENRIHTIVLNSLGGSVEEGLNIAGTVFDKKIKTYVPKGFVCYSACSFIFFAGSKKYTLGKLGVHQTAFAKDISKEKAAIGTVTSVSQLTTADILLRLSEFNTPRFVEQRMFRTAPEDMYIFNKKEISELGNSSVSNDDKILFKKIDKFIKDLEKYNAEKTCNSNASKCSSDQLCLRAAAKKSWLTSTETTKYVTEAKRRGLTCDVPIPICPKNIKKCNREYLCTYATTSMDAGLTWLNNAFADEAKSRGYKCGIILEPVIKKKPEVKKSCFSDPSICKPNELCKMATERNKTNIIWSTNTLFKDYVDLAKKLRISCGVKKTKPYLRKSCFSDVKLCNDNLVCRKATEDTADNPKWSKKSYFIKYVTEAKRRKLTCGVKENSASISKSTCLINPKECIKENLCFIATKKIGINRVWETNTKFLDHVNYAKSRDYKCEVKSDTKKNTSCFEDTEACSDEELCNVSTKNTSKGKDWKTSPLWKKHVTKAKKIGLSCGLTDLNKNKTENNNFISGGKTNVYFIQAYLNILGCKAGKEDGLLGQNTISALKRWKNNGGNFPINKLDMNLRTSLKNSKITCDKR